MATIDVKEEVRKRYGAIAERSGSCCGSSREVNESKRIGYSDEELTAVPEGANLGLGCGNPLGLAALEPGQTVLDLGSGAGFDAFLAANKVGKMGHVIGVDMTDAMLEKARANAKKGGYSQVEFRKGEIEALPVDDETIDVITSNCVINLSPDKPAVFREAYRVLKPGGRAFISDIVLLKELPEAIRNSTMAYTACVGGAVLKDDYLQAARDAGFAQVNVTNESRYGQELVAVECSGEGTWLSEFKDVPRDELLNAARSIVSVKVELRK